MQLRHPHTQMARPDAEPDPPLAVPGSAAGAAVYSPTGLPPWAVAVSDLDAEFHTPGEQSDDLRESA